MKCQLLPKWKNFFLILFLTDKIADDLKGDEGINTYCTAPCFGYNGWSKSPTCLLNGNVNQEYYVTFNTKNYFFFFCVKKPLNLLSYNHLNGSYFTY